MSDLQSRLQAVANDLVMQIIAVLKDSKADELFGVLSGATPNRAPPPSVPTPAPAPRAPSVRLERRTTQDIGQTLDRIVDLLEHNPEGLRSEEIRSLLRLEVKELPRPITEGLTSGRIKKTGQKRATTYFVMPAAAPGKGVKKPKK
jgi:hypothetical protein